LRFEISSKPPVQSTHTHPIHTLGSQIIGGPDFGEGLVCEWGVYACIEQGALTLFNPWKYFQGFKPPRLYKRVCSASMENWKFRLRLFNFPWKHCKSSCRDGGGGLNPWEYFQGLNKVEAPCSAHAYTPIHTLGPQIIGGSDFGEGLVCEWVCMRVLNKGLRENFKSQKGPRIRVFHEISDTKIFFNCGPRSTLGPKKYS